MELIPYFLFAGALFLNAGVPGPSIAALVSRVITNGWRNVIPFIAAMWIGEVIWLSMAMAGLTTLAQTFQTGFYILKWVSIFYLCWLAFKMWRKPVNEKTNELPQRTSSWSMFSAGMAFTYLALLPSFIDLPKAGLSEWSILASITLVTLAAIDLTWTFMAHRARVLLRTPKAVKIANRLGAVAMGGAAAVIAVRN